MRRYGFVLLEIIIVIALIILLFGGGFYLKSLENRKNVIESGIQAEKKIREIQQQIQNQNRSSSSEENIINQLSKPLHGL